jgi:hypothetical protein
MEGQRSAMDKKDSIFTKHPRGDILSYGTYNGQPILWRVLDQEGNKRLLLTQDIIVHQPYNKEYDNTYWQTCSLRRWLNQTFFQNAFSFKERTRILNSRLENPANPRYSTPGGSETVDKLFPLSFYELIKYLPHDEDRALGDWWWTRTPGMNILSAVSVYENGSIYDTGINIHFADGGVRPAMWILLRD